MRGDSTRTSRKLQTEAPVDRRFTRGGRQACIRLCDFFRDILKINRWKHTQQIWTEHMRNGLNVSRTSALIASALALDPEPLAKHPHAVENIPITEPLPKEPPPTAVENLPPTVPEHLEPSTDDNSATRAGCSSSTLTPSVIPPTRLDKKKTRPSKSSAPAPAAKAGENHTRARHLVKHSALRLRAPRYLWCGQLAAYASRRASSSEVPHDAQPAEPQTMQG